MCYITPTYYLKQITPDSPDFRRRCGECAQYLFNMGWRVEKGIIAEICTRYGCKKDVAREVVDWIAYIGRCH